MGALGNLIPEDHPVQEFLDIYDTIDGALNAAGSLGIYVPDEIAAQLADYGLGLYGNPETAGWFSSQGPNQLNSGLTSGLASGLAGFLSAWNMYNATGNLGNAIGSGFFTGVGTLLGGPIGGMFGNFLGSKFASTPDTAYMRPEAWMQYVTPTGAALRTNVGGIGGLDSYYGADIADMNQVWSDVQNIQRFDMGLLRALEQYYEENPPEHDWSNDLDWALRTYNRAIGTGDAVNYHNYGDEWLAEQGAESLLDYNLTKRWEAAQHWFSTMLPEMFANESYKDWLPTVSPEYWDSNFNDIVSAMSSGGGLIEGPDGSIRNTHIWTPQGTLIYTPEQEIVTKSNNTSADVEKPHHFIVDELSGPALTQTMNYNDWASQQDPFLEFQHNWEPENIPNLINNMTYKQLEEIASSYVGGGPSYNVVDGVAQLINDEEQIRLAYADDPRIDDIIAAMKANNLLPA